MSVAVAEDEPGIVEDETEHEPLGIVAEQEKLTVPAKPPDGVTVIVEFAEEPAPMLCAVEFKLMVKEGTGAVMVSGTVFEVDAL